MTRLDRGRDPFTLSRLKEAWLAIKSNMSYDMSARWTEPALYLVHMDALQYVGRVR